MATLSGIITPSNIVTATSTNTLTNKTLTAPTIASANLTTALTLAGAAGTAGQFLQSAGSGSAPVWAAAGASVVRSTKTANYTLVAGDKGNLVVATSGTFTFAFTAAATLGDGWFCYLQNAGTGDITLNPDASETIDGLTSYIMYSGETRLVQCTGTAFNTIVLDGFYKTFTESGTFTKPPGYSAFCGLLWAGGGSGRKDSGDNAKAGGAGGACAKIKFEAASLDATTSVTIGAGGVAVTSNATSGNVGGTSTFSTASAFAGTAAGASSGTGGSAYFTGLSTTSEPVIGGGVFNSNAVRAYLGGAGSVTAAGTTTVTVFGGAAGGGMDGENTLSTSTSIFGGAGGAAVVSTSGVDGSAPGGGGGATKSGAQSGAGARGELRIWGIA